MEPKIGKGLLEQIETRGKEENSTLDNRVIDSYMLDVSYDGTTTTNIISDEAGQFTNLQYIQPGIGYGTTSQPQWSHFMPAPPKHLDSLGQLWRDENNFIWVMSEDGWKRIVDNGITFSEPIVTEKGTKRKLKCF